MLGSNSKHVGWNDFQLLSHPLRENLRLPDFGSARDIAFPPDIDWTQISVAAMQPTVPVANVIRLASDAESGDPVGRCGMLANCCGRCSSGCSDRGRHSKPRTCALRQQIIVLQRTAPKRLCFNTFDRVIFVGLYRLFPNLRDALAVVRPETVIRWHRAGFRAYWRWRSRPRRGRPTVPLEIRQLIREMSLANPLWGAPRI
ncbi:MAG: hypothetical protein WB822_03405, partial [Rhodoplanes sp.]